MEAQAVRDGLDQGDMLNWYRIDRVLGRGGFGITYLATDTNLKTQVAIKEYLPADIATRDSDNTLRPSTTEAKDVFQWGLDRFISEAQTLARFGHPNIVRVLSVFQSNGTAYMVMEYQQGSELRAYLKQQPQVSETVLKNLFRPIIGGLGLVHQLGFIHRDIKPSNIMVTEDGSPVLIDFGSARRSYDSQTSTLTSLVSAGYTPLEQYNDSNDDKQGPWTDIYACGAVLHYAITGKPPPDATQRGSALLNRSADPLKPLSEVAAGRFSLPFLHAIDWALSFSIADRPKTLDTWSARLFAEEVPHPVAAPAPARKAVNKPREKTVLKTAPVSPQPVAPPAPLTRGPGSASLSPQAPAPEPPTETDDWDLSFLGNAELDSPEAVTKDPEKNWSVKFVGVLLLAIAGAGGYLYYQGYSPATGLGEELASNRFPVDRANQQMAKLASALSQADLGEVTKLGKVSAQSLSMLNILFRQFDQLEVEVLPLQAQSDQEAIASIKVVKLTRADGSVAIPAKAFESLGIELTQTDSGEIELALNHSTRY